MFDFLGIFSYLPHHGIFQFGNYFNVDKNCLTEENIHFFIQNVRRTQSNRVFFFFFIVGLTCISKHDDFEAVVLLKSTFCTALVALHDRESCDLEKRNEIANRQLKLSQFLRE